VIVCPRCSKENQAHYKFCLGCGTELPRNAAQAPNDFRAPTPAAGMSALEHAGQDAALAQTQAGSLHSPLPPKATPADIVQAGAAARPCPSCGTMVPHGFKFCGSCGHRMDGVPSAVQPGPVAPSPAGGGTARGSLVLINPDGSEGERVLLLDGETRVGRGHGALFEGDSYLSPLHATFFFKGRTLHVRDEGSLNGVFVKLEKNVPVTLMDGSVFRIGQEILRYEALPAPQRIDGVEVMGSPNPGYAGRLCLVVGRNPEAGNAFPVPAHGMYLGRERGEVLFPEDGYVSGLHCRVHAEGGKVLLTDVGSSNGTFLRVRGDYALKSGDLLLMGQQLFRAQL
jgi:pSer/pThr/pTyr-binding forkhead associated (FHA) protein